VTTRRGVAVSRRPISLGTGSLGTGSLGTGSLGTGSLGTGSLGTGSRDSGHPDTGRLGMAASLGTDSPTVSRVTARLGMARRGR
jgi:hypothetical protein